MENSSKKQGFINAWFDGRAFGFIHENQNSALQVYFFHISSLLSGIPRTGAKVKFNVGSNPKGPTAIDVEVELPSVALAALSGVRS